MPASLAHDFVKRQIFTFVGAAVKDAEGVRNVARIIDSFGGSNVLVVVSAMGKSTNALERIIEAAYHQSPELPAYLQEFKSYHNEILADLFPEEHLFGRIDVQNLYLELECAIDNANLRHDYDFFYDQIIAFGELISTRIVSAYLLFTGLRNQWIDSRNFILTDDRYRDAKVMWNETEVVVNNRLRPLSEKNLVIAQGFIGKGPNGENTTLGREGSDYTAAIYAHLLGAESVTIWKDVPGVMNADPKKFEQPVLLDQLSYEDAIELAYYGASVIHPKTIQPLQAAGIPLFVRSFTNPTLPGTRVDQSSGQLQQACLIHKSNQALLQFSTRNLTFIAENQLMQLFTLFNAHKIRLNLMQNAATHFTCVIDYNENRLNALRLDLANLEMNLSVTVGLDMISVYQPSEGIESRLPAAEKWVMKQQTDRSTHYVIRP
ncbi:MAG: aspartate kinase [Bacteroidia bacterium]